MLLTFIGILIFSVLRVYLVYQALYILFSVFTLVVVTSQNEASKSRLLIARTNKCGHATSCQNKHWHVYQQKCKNFGGKKGCDFTILVSSL